MEARGRAGLAEVRKLIARGWPPGLTVLTGDDLYHLEAAERELVRALLPGESAEFGLTVLGRDRIDVANVVAAARSAGMFAPVRVVLVRDVGALEGEPAPLVEFAARPPARGFLIVRAPKLDKRFKLHQALDSTGKRVSFSVSESFAELEREAIALAAARNLELDADAAALLVAAFGGDFFRIDGELAKIGAWLGPEGGARVDAQVVRENAAGSGLASGWEIANAVLRRDGPQARVATRRLLEIGEEPLRLLGGLAFRARAMLAAKALIERGAESKSAFGKARLFGPSHAEMERGLARYKLAELLAFPAILLAADRDMKSRALDDGAILEQAVERLIGKPGGAGR